MSLAIDPATVRRVLLAGQWHNVIPGSFDLDAYEYVERERDLVLHGGGRSGICATGFRFLSESQPGAITGPLSSVDAVWTGE